MTLLSLSPSSSSDPSSTGAFFIYLEYLDAKKMMGKVEISTGCEENERQSSEILNVIAPIAFFP